MTIKTATLLDFLTEDQIDQIAEIVKEYPIAPATLIRDEVIAPHLDEISQRLGQECDPMFLAYACEYVVRKLLV